MGYATPVYFYVSLIFLADKLTSIRTWPRLYLHFPSNVPSPVYLAGAIAGTGILLMAGLYIIQRQLTKSNVFIRRSWVVIIFCLITSLIVVLSSHISMQNIWLLAMPALSLIISHTLYLEKNKRFSNFAFYFSLLLVIFCQVALNN